MIYLLPQGVLDRTFNFFRQCGLGRRECQVLWTSTWHSPELISAAVHTIHQAYVGGFNVNDAWITAFWLKLAQEKSGIRVQVHTHPGTAFHSPTDDENPIIHTPGFLSLVIPNFALGSVGFLGAYLTEIGEDGRWCEVPVHSRLKVV
jgi:hypothetical protein